jgi:hypothetical protein
MLVLLALSALALSRAVPAVRRARL